MGSAAAGLFFFVNGFVNVFDTSLSISANSDGFDGAFGSSEFDGALEDDGAFVPPTVIASPSFGPLHGGDRRSGAKFTLHFL